MIYIDPPYNTGNDFVYVDNYSVSLDDYKINSGDYSNSGDRLVQNSSNNGRFHSNWLNMIYPRLLLSRDLLRDDGIIFISIDDNELANLHKLCDEIFGEKNFIAQIIIDGTPKNDPLIVSTAHEYCLVYVKDYSIAKDKTWGICNPIYLELINIYNKYQPDYPVIRNKLKEYYDKNDLNSDNISNYKYADIDGIYRIGPIDDPQGAGPKDQRINPKTGSYCATPASGWRCAIGTWNEWISQNLIEFPEIDSKLPAKKTYISKDKLDVLRAYFKIQTRKDTDMLKSLFDGKKVFLFPKPLDFIRTIIEGTTSNNDIILDFFSGSGTTAHAVMAQAQKSGNKYNYILVQLPENLEDNLRFVSGNRSKQSIKDAIDYCRSRKLPPTICEIAKERIRKVGTKLKQENVFQPLDVGFRVYKLDSSNMTDVFYDPASFRQQNIEEFGDNVKPDRSSEDLLIQVMLDLRIELSAKIDTEVIENTPVSIVDDGFLVACLSDQCSESVITAIAKREIKPVYAVIRNGPGMTDQMLSNIEQIFKTYSPGTEVRYI